MSNKARITERSGLAKIDNRNIQQSKKVAEAEQEATTYEAKENAYDAVEWGFPSFNIFGCWRATRRAFKSAETIESENEAAFLQLQQQATADLAVAEDQHEQSSQKLEDLNTELTKAIRSKNKPLASRLLVKVKTQKQSVEVIYKKFLTLSSMVQRIEAASSGVKNIDALKSLTSGLRDVLSDYDFSAVEDVHEEAADADGLIEDIQSLMQGLASYNSSTVFDESQLEAELDDMFRKEETDNADVIRETERLAEEEKERRAKKTNGLSVISQPADNPPAKIMEFVRA